MRSVVGLPGLRAGEDVKYQEYVEELMRLLFQALARPAPGEEEPASSQEGEAAEKKTKIFSAGGLQSLPDVVYYPRRG